MELYANLGRGTMLRLLSCLSAQPCGLRAFHSSNGLYHSSFCLDRDWSRGQLIKRLTVSTKELVLYSFKSSALSPTVIGCLLSTVHPV